MTKGLMTLISSQITSLFKRFGYKPNIEPFQSFKLEHSSKSEYCASVCHAKMSSEDILHLSGTIGGFNKVVSFD